MKFCGSAAMREMDRYTIEELGVPGETLMLRAASGAAAAAGTFLGDRGRVLVLCGSGNNGGDGIGIAADHMEAGHEDSCVMVGNPEKLTDDGKKMLARLQAAGGDLIPCIGPEIIHGDWDLIVDALLGTGLSRPVSGVYRDIITAVNDADVPVLACDIASGLSSDTGEILGCAVRADTTVTFNLPKTGQLLPPGTEYTGRLLVHDIGIPEEALLRAETAGEYVTGDMVKSWLPKAKLESHKGDFGKLLLLCGSTGYTGAAAMAAKAALRTGAGLVYLAVPEPVYSILASKLDEAVVFPMPANGNGRFARSGIPDIQDRLRDMDACLVGPGIGQSYDTEELVYGVLETAACPVVLDADALNVLAGHVDRLRQLKEPVVLTPHEGEFRRLGGDPGRGRMAAAREMAERTGQIIVLKGYRTIVAGPGGELYVNSTGNPGMATGGSGDVLAGILTCLLGQGMDPLKAAVSAVWIHGAAGDLCRDRLGIRSMLPSDIIAALSEILM